MGCSSFCPSHKPKRSMFVASASPIPQLLVESAAGLLLVGTVSKGTNTVHVRQRRRDRREPQ